MDLPKNIFINPDNSAKTAMKLIDTNGWGVVFVVDKKMILRGVVTPGDIRRAIDVGYDISNTVESLMNEKPLIISEGINPKAATAIIFENLKEKESEVKEEINHIKIPVINQKKQVIDIATFNQTETSLSLAFGLQASINNQGIGKVLIVGGAGYLGSVLSRLLLSKGYRVRVLDSLLFGEEPIKELATNSYFELIKGDVRNIQTLHKSLYGVDAVIHLAAIVGDPASQKFPQDTIGVNYLASMTLALACKYYQINKFIFASTCSVYGVGANKLDEQSPLNPVSLYARTKIESEKGILSLADDNFRPVIMRMSTLYGPSPRMRFDLVVNTFAKMAATEGRIVIFGGNQWRPLLHVSDAAQAYLQALENPLPHLGNLVFNVGTDEQNFTIAEIGQLVKTVLPETKVITKKQDKNTNIDKRTYQVSFKKIEKELSFKANNTVSEALLAIYDSIITGKIKDPTNDNYYNVVQ